MVPPDIRQYFIPGPASPSYTPVILGAARVAFSDAKLGVDEMRELLYAAPVSDGAVAVDWEGAQKVDVAPRDLQREPASPDASFGALPSAAQQPKNYTAWQKAFSQWLSRYERLEVLRHKETKLTSRPGEDERSFTGRVQDARRATRDQEVEALRRKYATRRDALVERIRKAAAAVDREQQQASDSKTQTMLSVGAAALGALFGRKAISTGTLGRATTAARGVGRSMREAGDVKRAAENVDAQKRQLEELDQQIAQATQEIVARYDAPVQVERLPLAPKRGQVTVEFVALGWDPR